MIEIKIQGKDLNEVADHCKKLYLSVKLAKKYATETRFSPEAMKAKRLELLKESHRLVKQAAAEVDAESTKTGNKFSPAATNATKPAIIPDPDDVPTGIKIPPGRPDLSINPMQIPKSGRCPWCATEFERLRKHAPHCQRRIQYQNDFADNQQPGATA